MKVQEGDVIELTSGSNSPIGFVEAGALFRVVAAAQDKEFETWMTIVGIDGVSKGHLFEHIFYQQFRPVSALIQLAYEAE